MARGRTAPSPARPIQVTLGGKDHKGSYTIEDRTITVAYLGRTETKQIVGATATAESLAKSILTTLVSGARRRG